MILEELRDKLTAIDAQLISLMAQRQSIVREIGATKIRNEVPTRDYKRERKVLEAARARALEVAFDPDVAERIMQELIRTSLAEQEQSRVAAGNSGAGARALVIGGSGKMGGWFAEFLASQGYAVEVADPTRSEHFAWHPDWQDLELTHELIVVATPIRMSNGILLRLADRCPPGIVLDLGSLKTPLRSGLMALRDAGCRVTSLHPMFGPDTRLLSDRHVVVVDLGVAEATQYAKGLFSSTMATLYETDIDEHDRLIAYVLGLSHALNLAFFTALADSGELLPRLMQVSSTTFEAQLHVARRVAEDNPHLYFEIQALNEFGGESLAALERAVERIKGLVAAADEAGFRALMLGGRDYTAPRQRAAYTQKSDAHG